MAEARRAPGLADLGELRLRLAIRRLRGRGGAAEAVAQVVLFLAALPLAVFFAALIGFGSYQAARAGHGLRATVPVTAMLYGVWQTWTAVSLTVNERDALDLRRLLVYPVRPLRLYLLGLGTSLFADPFAMFWLVLLGGMLVGAGVARPGPWVLVLALVLATFAAATVSLVSLGQELLARLAPRRFWRELAVIATVVAWVGIVVSLSGGLHAMRAARPALVILRWVLYPAALATEASRRLFAGDVRGSLPWLASLAVAAIVTAWIAYRVAVATARSGGEAGGAPRARGARRAGWLPRWFGPLFEKELLYLSRHPATRIYALVLPAIAAVIGWKGPFRVRPELDELVAALPLFGLAAYVHLALQTFWVNALGWERGGARTLFLAPVAPQRILEAKNVALWLYASALFALTAGAYVALAGPPPLWAAAGAVALEIGLAPVLYALGNVVSVIVPRAAPLGLQRTGSVSPVAALAAMAITSGAVALFAAPVLVALWADAPWLVPLGWTVLGVGAIVAWRASLPLTGALLARRREAVLAAVCGDDA